MNRFERDVIKQAMFLVRDTEPKTRLTLADQQLRFLCLRVACRALVESRKRDKKRSQKTVSATGRLPAAPWAKSVPKYL